MEKMKKDRKPYNSKLQVDTRNILIGQRINNFSNCYSCCIDGWYCLAKEVHISEAENELLIKFEENLTVLETLPNHPHVTRYFFHKKKGAYMVWYFSGQSTYQDLGDYISKRRNEGIDTKTIVKYCIDIVSGLSFITKHKISHPHLLSEDIIVSGDPMNDQPIRLIVGNLEKFSLYKLSKHWRQRKQVLSLPIYAPEILDQSNIEKAQGSPEQTVWSFGMILYELIALKKPYSEVEFFRIPDLILRDIKPIIPKTPEVEFVCTLIKIASPDKYSKMTYKKAFQKSSLKLTCLFYICQNWDVIDPLMYNKSHVLPHDIQSLLSIFFDLSTHLDLIEMFELCTQVEPSKRPTITTVQTKLDTIYKNRITIEKRLFG